MAQPSVPQDPATIRNLGAPVPVLEQPVEGRLARTLKVMADAEPGLPLAPWEALWPAQLLERVA